MQESNQDLKSRLQTVVREKDISQVRLHMASFQVVYCMVSTPPQSQIPTLWGYQVYPHSSFCIRQFPFGLHTSFLFCFLFEYVILKPVFLLTVVQLNISPEVDLNFFQHFQMELVFSTMILFCGVLYLHSLLEVLGFSFLLLSDVFIPLLNVTMIVAPTSIYSEMHDAYLNVHFNSA